MANQIKYGVKFDVDTKSLNQLKSSLQQIKKVSLDDIMKADFEDELRSSTGLILPAMENKDMYLLYDKYEKKTDNNNTQFYVIISAIAILVIISVFKLIQKDEKEIKQ